MAGISAGGGRDGRRSKLPAWADYGAAAGPQPRCCAFLVSGLVVCASARTRSGDRILVYGALRLSARRSATRSTTPPTSSSPGSPSRSPSMPACSTSAARARPISAGSGSALVGLYLGWLPGVLSIPLAIAGGRAVRRRLGLHPRLAAGRRGSHVVITTIMFNFVAAALMTYLLVNVLIKPGPDRARRASPSPRRAGCRQLSGCSACSASISATPLNLSLRAGAALLRRGLAVHLAHRLGYELRVVGQSEPAARLCRHLAGRSIILAMTHLRRARRPDGAQRDPGRASTA